MARMREPSETESRRTAFTEKRETGGVGILSLVGEVGGEGGGDSSREGDFKS